MGKRRKKRNKRNKNSKGNNMGWFGNKVKSAVGAWNKTKPSTGKDPQTLSVALFKQSTLDEIAEICLPKAGGSEFQVHYRGLQIVIADRDSQNRVVFTIPTVFFNMTQKVTSGSVDFNQDEVAELSAQVAPISEALANKMAAAFPTNIFKDRGFDIEFRELEMGSMHRHPGNFGFSTIDLDNQVENPGVIFRRLQCNDLIQVDSVMYIPNKSVQLVTTETRVITVAPHEDGGIAGEYLEAPTLSYIIQDEVQREDFSYFFEDVVQTSDTKVKFKIAKKHYTKDHEQIEEVLQTFLNNFKYIPVTIIDPEMIEQAYTRTYGTRQVGNHYYDGFDYDDHYYSRGTGYTTPTHKTTRVTNPAVNTAPTKPSVKPAEVILPDAQTQEQNRIKNRPLWRHTQTKSLLTGRKIDLQQYPEIDGKGSNKDAITIVQALKDHQYTDDQVREFLSATGYPVTLTMNLYYESLADSLETSKESPTPITKVDDIVETIDVKEVPELSDEKATDDKNEIITLDVDIVNALKELAGQSQEELNHGIEVLKDTYDVDTLKAYLKAAGLSEDLITLTNLID